MTFGNLKTRTQRLVIDLPPAVQAEVPDLINDAIRSMQRRYNYRAMERTQTFTTVEGSLALGSLPLFKEYRDKGPFMLREYARSIRLLTVLDTDVDAAVFSNVDLPTAPEFIMDSTDDAGLTTFTIAPYPDAYSDWADGNYRVVVPYYAYTAKLVNDGDQNWFTENAEDYIIMQAAAEGFGRDWDYDSMALWLQRAESRLEEVKQTDKKRRLATVDTLVPMYNGANQPQVRR